MRCNNYTCDDEEKKAFSPGGCVVKAARVYRDAQRRRQLRFSNGKLLAAFDGAGLVVLRGEYGAPSLPRAGDRSGHMKISDASSETRKRLSLLTRSAASTSPTWADRHVIAENFGPRAGHCEIVTSGSSHSCLQGTGAIRRRPSGRCQPPSVGCRLAGALFLAAAAGRNSNQWATSGPGYPTEEVGQPRKGGHGSLRPRR
jgi:hypothetical protein